MEFLLVHSPFLGPGVWTPLASILIDRGHRVIVPDLRDSLGDSSPYEAMARSACANADGQAHLIMHSGAGALAPSIWAADQRITRMIFLDALLPHPDRSWSATLPIAMAERLKDAVVAGLLPRWPDWLPTGVLEQLIPDDDLRVVVAAEAVAAPLAFATAKAPRVVGWEGAATCRYIQLSDAYDREAKKAAEVGMAVDRFDGAHFSMVSTPAAVADLLLRAVPSGQSPARKLVSGKDSIGDPFAGFGRASRRRRAEPRC